MNTIIELSAKDIDIIKERALRVWVDRPITSPEAILITLSAYIVQKGGKPGFILKDNK